MRLAETLHLLRMYMHTYNDPADENSAVAQLNYAHVLRCCTTEIGRIKSYGEVGTFGIEGGVLDRLQRPGWVFM